jgi:hypothetical protein
VAIFIATLGVLIAARGGSRRAEVVTAASQLPATPRADANAQPETKPTLDKNEAVGPRDTPKMAAPKPSATPVATETRAVDVRIGSTQTAEPKTSAVEATVKRAAPAEPPIKTPAAELTATPQAIDSTPRANVHSASPATITGCLSFDEETFWLKDTMGDDAPKSRSWKWGFLKKRSSSIELVDAFHTLELPNHVGQRITITGTLSHREMRAYSLRRVAASCN